MGRTLNILALEPYYGGSHRHILSALQHQSRHKFELHTMPARKWKWRMRGAAIELADRAGALGGGFDIVLASDMMSVADFRALAPRALRDVPVVTYFHENQLTHPLPDESERDYQYGFTNITTCLASDEVWFNSAYHMAEFLKAALLKKMPDFVPKQVVERIAGRSRVVHPAIDVPAGSPRARRRPYTVLWNHRWEWDKNPEEFFAALRTLREAGCAFRLAVVGESFRERPAVFDEALEEFADVIGKWGYVESRQEYLGILRDCDIVVSTALHEFFGLAVLEAAGCGCVPLLPRRLAYPEVFDERANPYAFYDDSALAVRLGEMLRSESLPQRAQVRRLAERYLWESRIAGWDGLLAGAAERERDLPGG